MGANIGLGSWANICIREGVRGLPTTPKMGFAGWDAHALGSSWIVLARGVGDRVSLRHRVPAEGVGASRTH